MPRAAIIQSTFDFAIREINALETRIVKAEDDADSMLWEQARQVVEQLETVSLRKLAKQWINVRAKPPVAYSHVHVHRVALTVERYFKVTPRPRFRDVYNEICNAAGPVNRIIFNSHDNEWYTPPEIIEAATSVLGPIDLDPSSCALANTVVGARQFYDLAANGLNFPWAGTVWMNPPYDQPAITEFSRKFADHVRSVKDGIVRFDCDVLLHRYKVEIDKKSTRDIQCLMFVEVKTHNAEPSPAQRDTLSLMAQVLRNRRRNVHRDKRGQHAKDHVPMALAFSWLLGRDIRLKMFGGHLLQLSGLDPVTSDHMAWDRRPVTIDELVALLRFEIDPDSFSPVDWRRRYRDFYEETLWDQVQS